MEPSSPRCPTVELPPDSVMLPQSRTPAAPLPVSTVLQPSRCSSPTGTSSYPHARLSPGTSTASHTPAPPASRTAPSSFHNVESDHPQPRCRGHQHRDGAGRQPAAHARGTSEYPATGPRTPRIAQLTRLEVQKTFVSRVVAAPPSLHWSQSRTRDTLPLVPLFWSAVALEISAYQGGGTSFTTLSSDHGSIRHCGRAPIGDSWGQGGHGVNQWCSHGTAALECRRALPPA